MKTSIIRLFLASLLFKSTYALADSSVCKLRGNAITNYASEIYKRNGEKWPDSTIVNLEVSGQILDSDLKYSAIGEAFVKPEDDLQFSIIPTSLASVKLDKDKHLIYVCAEVKDDARFTIELDFLGKSLSGGFISKLLHSSAKEGKVELMPLKLQVLSIGADADKKGGLAKLLSLPFAINSKIISGIANTLAGITGVEIERVTLTEKFAILEGGIDLDKPNAARFRKVVEYNSPEFQHVNVQ